MVSSSYYSSYGYPGYGYNQQGGSMLGNTSMSSAYSSLGDAPDLDPANVHAMTDGVSDTYNNAMKPQEEKGGGGLFGGIGDFFKGIVKGATNLVKSLADPKTWLMIGAAALLCFVFPPAGYALLALGLFTSGSQILGGLTSGNMEQVGEGAFNLGITAVGAKGMGGAVKGKDGVTYTAAAGKAAKAASSADDAARIASQADDAAAVAAKASTGSADDVANVKNLQTQAKQAHQHADDLAAAQIKAEARVAYKSTPKADRKALVDGKPTQENITAAKTNLDNARSNLYNKQSELAGMKQTDAGYAAAKSAVDDAQSLVSTQSSALRTMQYKYEMAAQSQRGFFGRTWDSLGDNFTVMKGGKLADPKSIGKPGQGSQQQISLYNRGPKAPGAESGTQSGGFLSGAMDKAKSAKDTIVSKVTGKPKPTPTPTPTPTSTSTMPSTGGHQLGGTSSSTPLTRQQIADIRAARYGNTSGASANTPSGTTSTSSGSAANAIPDGTPQSSTIGTSSNSPASITDKAKGWLSPKLDPKTGQPIDKGAAGYWNYLTSHKMQSWVQGNTLGNMFGGQQGQQGGGLFSMFGMGGGAQGQGGLLG